MYAASDDTATYSGPIESLVVNELGCIRIVWHDLKL